MSALSVCGPQSSNEGCLQPCDDVLLCVRVERAQSDPVANETRVFDEFIYQFTVQNCSRSVLRYGQLRLRLGSFTCRLSGAGMTNAMFEAFGQVANDNIDQNSCGKGDFNDAWTGSSFAQNTDNEVLVFDNLLIPPGSWQGWVRFFSERDPASMVRLPSQVVFSASVLDPNCKAPCRITKCVEADGDNCMLTS